jgi:hypothetical protein
LKWGSRRVWPVSRGCLLLRGTWSCLRICRRSVLPYTRFCNCLLITITFYTLLTSLFCMYMYFQIDPNSSMTVVCVTCTYAQMCICCVWIVVTFYTLITSPFDILSNLKKHSIIIAVHVHVYRAIFSNRKIWICMVTMWILSVPRMNENSQCILEKKSVDSVQMKCINHYCYYIHFPINRSKSEVCGQKDCEWTVVAELVMVNVLD